MNKKTLSMLFIIIAGEAVFMLPFLIPRLFRPLMLEVYDLSNTDIGLAFSAYGVSSMVSYIIGGQFADKYHPRFLISISLLMTALGAAIFLFFPSANTLIVSYFYFGISTTLLMWGALIKVTHDTGGEEKRATAMGLLDSGRGLTAAVMSTFLLYILTFQTDLSGSYTNKLTSMQTIYITVISFTILVSIAIWFSLKNIETSEIKKSDWTISKAFQILKDLNVWLLGIIVLSAYCGYKNVDNYSIYLVTVQKVTLVESASFTSIIFWLRPIAALASGFLADAITKKVKGGRFITLAGFFLLGAISQFLISFKVFTNFNLVFNIILSAAGFGYALRSIYFAVFGDFRIPGNLIGTTVGIVSLVGFMPDMFFGTLTGHLIDSNPGELGFSHVFNLTGGFFIIGTIACIISYLRVRKT
jgi:MFS family permease